MKNKKKNLWNEKILFIRELKKIYSKINYNGINLWPIMANDVYTYYKNQNRDFFERLKLEIRSLFFIERLPKINKNKILASYFMPRKDHHKLVKKSLEKFNEKEVFFLDYYNSKKSKLFEKYKFNFPNFILIFHIWRLLNKKNLKGILGKYYFLFISRTYLRYMQINNFKKWLKDANPKAYIAFCSSAFPEEAIITLILKSKNIPTFTLQHGFLEGYSAKFAPISVVNENIISDYLLVWGKESKNIAKKYTDQKKIIIVGNPKYNEITKLKKKFNPRKATFFFSVSGKEESNKKIVKIINYFSTKNKDIKFKFKIHPFDDISNYKDLVSSENIQFVDKEKSIKGLLTESDFVIIHYTTIGYEALLYEIPILRFKDANFSNFWNYSDTFSNLKELELLFTKLKNQENYKKAINFYRKKKKEIFYFEKGKKVSEVYKREILKAIENHKDT